jgi:glycerol-3-phosphate acyltransferase PlsY
MMATEPTAIGLAIAGYLLGGVPFGVVVSKLLGTADPRTAGSRNVGFTNVLRVSGKTAGILTLFGDLGKGWLIAWLASWLLQHEGEVLLVAFMPAVGHIYSPYLKFRGGKVVATALGAVLGVSPVMGLTLLLIWLVTAAVWGYSSAGAIVAFAAFPILAVATQSGRAFSIFAAALSLVILQRHSGNIKRLWQGTEPKLGQGSS